MRAPRRPTLRRAACRNNPAQASLRAKPEMASRQASRRNFSKPLPPKKTSIVVSFVHRDGALLPISRGFDPILAQSTFVDEMPPQSLGGGRLRSDPGVAVT